MSQPKKIYTVSNLNILLSLWSISGIVDRIQPLHWRVFGRSGLERLSRPDLRLWGQRVWPLGPPPPAGVQQLHHQDGLDAGVTDGAGHRYSWLHQGLRSGVRRPQPSVLLPGAQRKSPGRDSGHLRRRLKEPYHHVDGRTHIFPVPQPGLVTNSTFFCFLFVKSSICLEGKSMSFHKKETEKNSVSGQTWFLTLNYQWGVPNVVLVGERVSR